MTLQQAWWQHLGSVRWFGGKGAAGSITDLTPLPWYTEPDAVPAVRSEVATIDYADGRREFYHLLVAHYPAGTAPVTPLATVEDADVVDATTDPTAVAAFVEACRTRAVSAMRWRRPQPAPWPTGVWGGEQSNTTVTLGGEALFKLFRRIEPGPNLDAEILDALDGSGCAVPALLGRLAAAWPAGTPEAQTGATDLGIVIERVPGAQDGWQLASAACAAETDFAGSARALGEALASVHAALLTAFGGAEASGDELAGLMTQRLDAATASASALVPYRDALASAFGALRGRKVTVQRIHGDFHLGQTLRSSVAGQGDTAGGGHRWWIIDFEGEPVKSAAERRAPDSPWRDVAGMLRSFDYARSAHAEPDSAAARRWAAQARTAFVEGYCGATGDAPADLLAAYETDKAVYEVVYETRNRPDWVKIPLRAVADRASAAGQAR